MKKYLFFLTFLMLSSITYAYDAEIDGIYYDLNSSTKTATVTYRNTNYNSYSGVITIPESVNYNGEPYSVTSIGNSAFYKCSGLTSVTIPNSVTSIGYRAFSGCSGLTSANIPNSVKTIGQEAFAGCSGLTSVTIPNSVTSIGNNAFYKTPWYNNQSDGVVYAGLVAYKYKGTMPANCEIILKEGTKSIADSAFEGCTKLTSVNIPNSVTSIGDGAFSDCSSLTSVNIPNSVKSIADKTFYGSGLTSITIPTSVTTIGFDAFKGCTSLASVTIPNSVIHIGEQAFQGCSSLTSIVIPGSVTDIEDDAFQGCTNLTSVTISEGVTSIGNCMFSNCYSLTSISIPNSVTTIKELAFMACTSLTSITIPSSVTSIKGAAFYECWSLTSVISYIQKPQTLEEETFDDISKNCTLYVPKGTRNAYIAKGWTESIFKGGIVEMEETPTSIKKTEEVERSLVNYYNMNGQRVSALQKGINIQHMSDGSVRKVLVK